MNIQVKKISRLFIRGIFKITSYSLFLLLIALTFIIISLRLTFVQQWIGTTIGEKATEILHHNIQLSKVQIDWFDHIALYDVEIRDYKDSSMIQVEEVWVDFGFLQWNADGKPTIHLQDIILKNGCVRLASYSKGDTVNINHFVYAIQQLKKTKDTSTTKTPFTIDDIRLVNMQFIWDNQPELKKSKGFDPNHLQFDSIYSFVEKLYVYSDTFRIQVKGLQTVESHSGLHVHQLDALYTFHPKYMELADLYARIGHSTIRKYLKFHYPNGIIDLKSFNTKTEIIAELDSCILDTRDLIPFASVFEQYPTVLSISSRLKGTVQHLNLRQVSIGLSPSTFLKGNIFIEGLPDISKAYFDAHLPTLSLHAKDIHSILPASVQPIAHRLNYANGNMDFTGVWNDFYTYGKLQTGLGELRTDMAMQISNNPATSASYEGHLECYQFNVGQLLNKSSLGFIQLQGDVKGKGFDPEVATIHLKSTIDYLEFNQYRYRNIKTDADIQQSAFNGHAEIKDSNMVLVVDGLLDFRNDVKIFELDATCKEARLKPLHFDLFNKDALFRSTVSLRFKGKNVDDAIGNGYITDTYLLYDGNQEIQIDSFHVSLSEKDSTQKEIIVVSDVFDLQASGDYTIRRLQADFSDMIQDYVRLFSKTDAERKQYFAQKTTSDYVPYTFTYALQIHDINDILKVYAPYLYVSDNSVINGSFKSGNTQQFKARGKIDTLYIRGVEFQKNKFNVFCSQKKSSDTLLGSVSFHSEKQYINHTIPTETFEIETVLYDKDINFYSSLSQNQGQNFSRLSGIVHLTDEGQIINFYNSYLSLKNKVWSISDNALIHWKNESIRIDSLTLQHQNQFISLNGTRDNEVVSGTTYLKDIQLKDFAHLFSKTKLSGEVNGVIKLGNEDLDGNLEIEDLKVDTFYVGNVQGDAVWDNTLKRVNVDVHVFRQHVNTIELKGYYQPNTRTTEEKIDLKAEFNDADISALNPVLKGVLTNIGGLATGNFSISGKLAEPLVKGEAFIKRGRFKIPYLGTTYTFEDYIRLEDDYIHLNNLELQDINKQVCKVYGGIHHTYFNTFILNLKGEVKEDPYRGFQALNLPESDTSVFYGEAYVNGNWEIIGPSTELKISANVNSKKDTRIYIPLNTTSTVTQSNYITFYEDSLPAQKQNKRKVDLSGIQLDLNFNINHDAYTELIFDKKAGDIIRGNGEGNMKLTIDTRGDFNMYGNYTILDGKYNFTLAGLINKEFTIQQGSTIAWNGNPYEGVLNINTEYEVFTPLKPIIQDQTLANSPDATRRYPVVVQMSLKGSLLQPEIGLGVVIPKKYPGQFTGEVLQFESYISNNPPELNKQVFSLIVMRKLMPYNTFTGIQGSYTNISELLSNQLSNYLSQVDENLDIYVDLSTLDNNGLSTFNMRLSYTAMDGRLRISRDGGYQYTNTTTNTTQTAMSAIGEWTVEYMLNPNGSLRVKVYNRVNQNSLITSTTSNATMTTGFSIQHTAGFDRIKEIFQRKTPKKKDRKKGNGISYFRRENALLFG